MKPWELALRWLNLFLAALVAGGQVLVLLAIVPVKRRMPLERSFALHQDLLIEPPDRYLRPAVLGMLLTALALLGAQAARRTVASPAGAWTALGLAATAGTMGAAAAYNFPINRVLDASACAAMPADYAALQGRWDKGHTLRTACGVLAFACYLAAALAPDRRR